MTKEVITITVDESCRSALRLMAAGDIEQLPVLDGERLVGLVTERDIHRRTFADGGRGSEDFLSVLAVSGVMAYAPPSVEPSAPLERAVELLAGSGVTSLAVVEMGRLRGILTRGDVLRTFVDGGPRDGAAEVTPRQNEDDNGDRR